MSATLAQLLGRGDAVAVEQGRLVIVPASGQLVPDGWFRENERSLIVQAAKLASVIALEYVGYAVGNYGPRRAGGVTLQLRCLADDLEAHVIFNADTTRARSTRGGKAGSPLPRGQFRVGKRSAFLRFWQSTGLPVRRLSEFHDYMGLLGGLALTGTLGQGSRVEATTLRPLDISASTLRGLVAEDLPDNCPTTARQAPDNFPTRNPDKETQQHQQSRGIQRESTTCTPNHGNTVIREHGETGACVPAHSQSDDEWLVDYENATNFYIAGGQAWP